jgi:hypothetical protein
MARMGTNDTAGKIGPVIYYTMKGKNYGRSMPRKFKQTQYTKTKAKAFGQAAGISRVWRCTLYRLIAKPNDLNLRHRLEKALRDWLNSDQEKPYFSARLNEFEFNPETPLCSRLKVSLGVQWMKDKVVVSIPEIDTSKDIISSTRTLSTVLLISVAGSTIKDPTFSFSLNTTHEISCEGIMPARELEIPYELKQGTVHVVAAALKYRIGNQYVSAISDDEKWTPAGVLSFYCEE